ncbi:MAG: hypothetical protein IPO16_10000 [Saprospiraceae bacterium]|nr:hypothetical protein [Saprospiraceae bacterium]
MRTKLLFLCILCISLSKLYSQQDTGSTKIQVIHADIFRFERIGGKEFQYLSKDVLVRHKNTYLLCDSAMIDGNKMIAIGHVRIVEGDSLQIYGDSLKYDGDKLTADFINNIVLKHKDQELFTNQLQYDLKIGLQVIFKKVFCFLKIQNCKVIEVTIMHKLEMPILKIVLSF